jgi:hypothetical protein
MGIEAFGDCTLSRNKQQVDRRARHRAAAGRVVPWVLSVWRAAGQRRVETHPALGLENKLPSRGFMS